MSSMPAFPHNFTPPVAESKRRSPDPFLSSEVPPSFLPASISFHPTKEGPLLSNMILDIKLATLQFKLAPSFTLYMTARFHISPNFQPGANNSELKKHLVVMLKNSVSFMKRAIKVRCVYSQYVHTHTHTHTRARARARAHTHTHTTYRAHTVSIQATHFRLL